MADEEDLKNQEQEEQQDSKENSGDKKTSGSPLLLIIIMLVVAIICAAAGFGLGRMLGSSETNQTAQSPEDKSNETEDLNANPTDLTGTESKGTWYYPLDPVVANLNEPSVTRYVRVALTMEVDAQVDNKKGTAFIDDKKPLLTNLLTIYFASLTLEEIRGDKNLKRIQSQLVDGFNEKLFPDAKPQIKSILFKEFAVQ
ncbi:MAG: flagellar basal body-associated FliL family protein [Planctomycetota bacterium]|jgi:flagellar basal body-associated protein FliL